MKQSKQQIQLPKLHTNVTDILSDIRAYLKERSNLTSITSKNGEPRHRGSLLSNHNSLNYIKVSPQEKSLMQRYKQIRQIEAPYREIVNQERQATDKSEKSSPRYQFQTHSKEKQKRLSYFRKKQKHSRSIENSKKSELIFQVLKSKQQKINCKQLCYCLNLVSQLVTSKYSKDDNRSKPSPQHQQTSPESIKKKPKSFLRQVKKIRRQSIKVSPYEPWQNNEQQYDLVY